MKKRRFLALALTVLLAFSLVALPAAASESAASQQHAARILFELGLFQGVGTLEDGSPDFDLESAPTRAQAVTMLVRLLGKDADAKAMQHTSPFTDVADWAAPYVGYAYQHGLTTGTSPTTFSGGQAVTPAQYLTFVLRALGYSSETDFQWERAFELSHDLMITKPGQYEDESAPFSRGDVATISTSALAALMKDSNHNLLSYLNLSGALSGSKLVLFDLELFRCMKDSMSFVFYPLAGSPNTYTTFQLDKVSVNGLPCKITQYPRTGEAIAALPELEMLYPDVFNYSLLSYDEEAAQKAATATYAPGDGSAYPLLLFTFECTGTLPSGETVKEVFSSEPIYIMGYTS